jgi:SAM-dependent methyltransferase
MTASSLWPYKSPTDHESISAIIRRRSTNQADVREVALRDLDLSVIEDVLDLGCGFGFMSKVLADRAAPNARFVGVDAWPTDEAPFLSNVLANGRTGSFTCMKIGSHLPWPDQTFDLVVCCYSLYFFVDVLPDIARVLKPHGTFLTITHSESSIVGDLPAAGFADAAAGLLSLIRQFSAENGLDILRKWFGQVTQINYKNNLRFEPEHADELLTYLQFKLPFLVPGSSPDDNLPTALKRYVVRSLRETGELIIDKNDAVFRCGSPLCR